MRHRVGNRWLSLVRFGAEAGRTSRIFDRSLASCPGLLRSAQSWWAQAAAEGHDFSDLVEDADLDTSNDDAPAHAAGEKAAPAGVALPDRQPLNRGHGRQGQWPWQMPRPWPSSL